MAELEFVVYTQSFCGACALTRERIELVVNAVGRDRVTWREINVAAEPESAEHDGIEFTPTVVLSRSDGTELLRAARLLTIEQLLGGVAAHLGVTPGG